MKIRAFHIAALKWTIWHFMIATDKHIWGPFLNYEAFRNGASAVLKQDTTLLLTGKIRGSLLYIALKQDQAL